MRHLILAAGLAVVFVVSQASTVIAASSTRSTNISYSSSSSARASAQMSQRQDEPVPANCIRQECGKLWCWQMKGSSSH